MDPGGGGTLNTSPITPNQPFGLSLDAATGKIYWADSGDNKIEFANVNDTGGGGVVNTTGASPNAPQGVAVDDATGKIYWANSGATGTDANTIGFANLNGSGGDLLLTAPVTPNKPSASPSTPPQGRSSGPMLGQQAPGRTRSSSPPSMTAVPAALSARPRSRRS